MSRDALPSHLTRRFVDFVREIEGKLSDDERRELDAWREHFRDDEGLGSPFPGPNGGPFPIVPADDFERECARWDAHDHG